MSGKTKVTVTLDAILLKEVDEACQTLHSSRSGLIERAIKLWRNKQLEEALREGYLAMAGEDLKTADSRLEAGVEVLDGGEGLAQKG